MKNILGLDLGTNSIGWAIVNANDSYKPVLLNGTGSRVIPTDAGKLGDFNKGEAVSFTKERRLAHGARTLRERSILRRSRLNRVLRELEFLPDHYEKCLDRYGNFLKGCEPKIAWVKGADGKYNFIFQSSFEEMLCEFRKRNANLATQKVPYDWTLYYLRKKALTQKIDKVELAWLLLNFNQKRGYYQLREEDENKKNDSKEEFYELKVVKVEETGEKKGKDIIYKIYFENGWEYSRSCRVAPDWEGKVKQLIVTTKVGKDGVEKRTFRAPNENDWGLVKKKSEYDIEQSNLTVGEFIYESLLNNNTQKIKGGLIRVIERKFYKNELKRILEKQIEFHSELQDRMKYNACIEALYQVNELYRDSIRNRDFKYLFVDDILFYQRPLKSQKHLISKCQFESFSDANGKRYGVKTVPKSHPLYAEFRLWQFIDNLKIYVNEKVVNGKLKFDVDITSSFLKDENDYVALFKHLYTLKTMRLCQNSDIASFV